jgi:hypothetical protein
MGFLGTEWDAEFEGHKLVVTRSELTRGFKLEWDGVDIAHRRWSFIGLGELHATAEASGRAVDVKVAIEFGGLSEMDGKCTITVDGKDLAVRHVK